MAAPIPEVVPDDSPLICFSYEYRSPSEARVCDEILWRYAERGIRTHNLFDAELHGEYEAGFNLARWEALDRYIKANDLYDARIIMQDITDVFVTDPDAVEFDARNVLVNRKKNCQYHALAMLLKDVTWPDHRQMNLSRRIDIDLTELDGEGLKRLFVDPRYRSLYRFSNDVAWGYGRSFVELHEKIRKHVERVPEAVRYGNCDETLYTFFHLHVPEARLNLAFGESQCQNYNYISQVLLGAASSREIVRTRNIFTYQHSERVPRLIDEMSEAHPRSLWRRLRPKPAYLLDRTVDGCLTSATIVLQELKRIWIAITYLRIRPGTR